MLNLEYKYRLLTALLAATFVLFAPEASFAGSFDALISSGQDIFKGLRSIIYPASAVGIIAVCIGGFFGNINWKWLTAIVLGLVVIGLCAGFVGIFVQDGTNAIPKGALEGGA